jgi:hypothetical protein
LRSAAWIASKVDQYGAELIRAATAPMLQGRNLKALRACQYQIVKDLHYDFRHITIEWKERMQKWRWCESIGRRYVP